MKKISMTGASMQDFYVKHAFMVNSKDSITVKEYQSDGNGGYGEGVYTDVSEIKAKHHNRTRIQMLGQTDFSCLSQEEAEKARSADIWVMTHREQLEIPELKVIRKGKTEWRNITIIHWTNPDDIVCGVICIARDITKRVVAQQRSKRLLIFLTKRIFLPMIYLSPMIKKLGPEHHKLAHALDEMLVRLKKILLNIE